ncbi:MAG: hypothetical protein E5Y10_24920 [Mesorhizobium sp.]|uniref:hypothetical protein n=1 Tax=Mesorhizobium sp. TaxID=1871066 RepID=UPI0012084002|nr:hypothetical protein [Mesorhizobium sp.]TIN38827.1 MAG: hypothetical protein E5Y13_15345 [Mesorhizobium sp.]TJU85665.1 MAG: hypothetical protein E5Y10_24920 [Mesorhizobium sp.]
MTTFLRFKDLKERGIVTNWPTLLDWIKVEGFPPGRYFGSNTRVWSSEEIDSWTASRPLASSESEAA